MQIHTHYRGLAWTAAMALFMQSLDATILNTALPAIAESLNQSSLNMQSAIISYALTVAALIPLSGWIADRLGTLNVFRFAVFTFVLGSVACALSPTLNALILSRILQGVGGALMMPVARLAIIRSVPKNQLISALNLMAMMGLIGPIIGPILGGWLATHVSWHWIFLINIPIGLVGILVAGKFMPNTRGERTPFDYKGFILFALALVGITYGLELLTEDFAHKTLSGSLIGGAFALMLIYVLYAKEHSYPILPLQLFQTRTFSVGLSVNLIFRISSSGIPFLLPLMLQVVFQFPADLAGWLLAPVAIGSIVMKNFTRPILRTLGYKKTLILNSLVMTGIILGFGLLSQRYNMALYLLLVSLYGLSVSLMFTAINTLTVCDLPDNLASSGSTMLSVVQQVGIGFGIAVSSVLLTAFRADNPLTSAFGYTFLLSASLGIVLVLLLFKLHRNDGENLNR